MRTARLHKSHSCSADATQFIQELKELEDFGLVSRIGIADFHQGSRKNGSKTYNISFYNPADFTFRVKHRGDRFTQNLYVQIDPEYKHIFELYIIMKNYEKR